jgi:threonine/homoserine/homoserine lactone efflux protein
MDVRQAPSRILYITTWTIVIGVLGSLFWLMTAPPAAYSNYQPLFQAVFDLVFGCIFIACGLFYYSWFATIMGADKASVILHFGPNRARIGYIISGVVFLGLGAIRVLLHMPLF